MSNLQVNAVKAGTLVAQMLKDAGPVIRAIGENCSAVMTPLVDRMNDAAIKDAGVFKPMIKAQLKAQQQVLGNIFDELTSEGFADAFGKAVTVGILTVNDTATVVEGIVKSTDFDATANAIQEVFEEIGANLKESHTPPS